MTVTTTSERKMRKLANDRFYELGLEYHDGLPLSRIDAILEAHRFTTLEEGIYTGRDGRVTEQVGQHTWFTMTWHKMDVTGRYEVVAYVS